MNIPFQYRSISAEFIGELCEMTLDGQSTVLLGPRYGGTRHVLQRLGVHLSEAQAGRIVHLKLLSDPPMSEAQRVKKLIQQAVVQAEPGLKMKEPGEDLLDALDQLHRYTGERIILIATNVDGMAHHLVRRFLVGIRKRVEQCRLVVALSGEDDFRDLVYGPNSEFNCANQFVLQGFAEDEFNRYLERYSTHLGEELTFSPASRHKLWAYTGGSIHLLKIILWALIESRVRSAGQRELNPDALDILSSLKTLGIPSAFGARVFLHANDIISRDPQCWDDLERLIKGKTVRVEWEDNPPGRLELSGVAMRKDNRLQFASELMESFVKQHYDDRRLGDLYAASGLWRKAFERYALLSLEETMRPSGINDKAAVEATTNALCAALHSEAANGIDSVQHLFVNGCRYLLGFNDIIFWRSGAAWKPVPLKDFTLRREVLNHIASLLPQVRPPQPGLLQLAEPLASCSLAAIIPTLGRDEWGAVVIGDFEKRTVISRERGRLARKMLEHFVSAYSHAVNVKKTEMRLQVRNQHIETINSIFDSLGGQVINTGEVIKMAARGLRQLGYQRVLFCLVDPQRKRIQGVWDDASDGVDVAAMTDWALDNPKADLQPYVIFTKKPKIVEDARFEPLANTHVVNRAKMRSEAIVPILNPENEAIGTIHIERADGAVPSRHEVDDLMVFAHQLAIAIEQSERVDLLQSALDKIPEPIIIADPLENVRYANKVAGDLLQVPVGWQSHSKARPLASAGTDKIKRHLRTTLQLSHRSVRHEKGIGTNSHYYGAVLLDCIVDWREKTIGALLHIEDLNHFYRVFDALRLIAEADDTKAAMQAMLQAMEKLGHKWAQLYTVDENDANRLVSWLCYGQLDSKTKQKFNQGKVVLMPRNESQPTDWQCIEKRRPLVFCWHKDRETGEEIVTPYGLKAYNLNPPRLPPEIRKEPGDFWIDFPLVTRESVLGKMCIQCDADYRPEDFELLRILSEGLLDALLRRDQEAKKKENLIRQTADSMIGLTAHNMNSRFAALAFILSDYQRLGHPSPELIEINDRFHDTLVKLSGSIKRMRERLGPLSHHFEEFDLLQLIKQTFSTNLPEQNYQMTSDLTELWVKADNHLLSTAMVELIHNTKSIIRLHDTMMIEVAIELQNNGSKDWVKITYKDNGPGIPPGLKEDIFKLFFSHRPGQEISTGIGLGYVRRVAEVHGGTIREVGKPGEGAKFEIVISKSTDGA